VLAAVSLKAARGAPRLPCSMIMMGGPIDARSSPTAVNDLAEEHSLSWFERNVIHTVPQRYPGYLRKVYPGFLQYAGFVSMNPSRHANSHWDYFKHLIKGDDDATDAHRAFYNEYNAVLDLSAEFYLDTIRVVFQEHLLPKGDWHVKGEHVRPQDIRQTALLTIEGALDDISGLGQTKAAHALCKNIAPSHRQHLEVPGAGHFGIFSGRRWRTLVAPTIRDFVASHACH
jgi:poly(3-hydroxybutyrate) depolymerase